MDQKIKTNAAISYFFLWELFLLAKSNPDFSHPFIRGHAKNATKIHLIFLVIFFLYKTLIENFLYIRIPVLLLSLSDIVGSLIFLAFFFVIVRGFHKAFKWEDASHISLSRKSFSFSSKNTSQELTESEKVIFITSFLPFFWQIVASKHPTELNSYWTKSWWVFSVIIVLLVLLGHVEILWVMTFLYILFAVSVIVTLFLHSELILWSLIRQIPSLDYAYMLTKAAILYLSDSLKLVMWNREKISFVECVDMVSKKQAQFSSAINEHLTSKWIAISDKLIFIPFLNLIYIPKYIADKKSIYLLAIAQWLIITVISALIWFVTWNIYSDLQVLLLFPIFIWISKVWNNPFYRIPVIYEIYILLDYISFWIFSNVKFLKEKKEEKKNMTFKV